MTGVVGRTIGWFDDDPDRIARDRREVPKFAPEMEFVAPSPGAPGGGWVGRLPLWPFDRPSPEGLHEMFSEGGLLLEVRYTQAYPMVPPDLWPRRPEPEIVERSQSVWHVLPSGALCLVQSVGQWQPEASLVELLLKAAGWHLEYGLMKRGQIERMTERGIVSDSSLDGLFVESSS